MFSMITLADFKAILSWCRQSSNLCWKMIIGPLIWPSIEENGVTRPKKYSELSATEALQADCDIKATNIILQGLPPEVYALERECKLYYELDKFAYKKGESLREIYLRFSLLLNEMNIYNMKLLIYLCLMARKRQTGREIRNVPIDPVRGVSVPPVNTYSALGTIDFRLVTISSEHKVFEHKAQSQEKDMVIKKLKERIKSLSGNIDKDKIKHDLEEIETINIELDHRVTKLIAENEHLKQTYKQLYDSIKPARVRSKEQCADLTNQVNLKSVEISDLNACLQEKVLINTKPITPYIVDKRSAHLPFIKHTQEEATVLRDLVDHIKANYPLDPTLESACKYTKLIQELLQKSGITLSQYQQFRRTIRMNKVKRVRFTEPVTSSRNIITKKASISNLASNKLMLSSIGVKPSTSASGSQPSGNTKKDKILQTQSSTQMNKVKAHPRKVQSSLKNKDHVVAPKGTAHVQHSKLNANSELKYVKCNGCMLSDNHDLYVLDYINNVNAPAKSKSAKKQSKRKVWKPTGKMFTSIGYIWRPTGQTFTIVRNACPLTRITTTTEAPLRKPVVLDNETSKPTVTLVYSRKPRNSKNNVLVIKSKVLQYVSANKKEPSKSWGSIISDVPSSSLNECRLFKLSSVKFRNDHVAKILGYGDYQIGNFTISRVYYVEGLRHNLFSVGQFCDSNLKVAFRQHACFIRNLEGVDLLTGSRGNNMYTLSLGDMMESSPISRHSLVRGLPKLKFEKDRLCSACVMGKSKKKPYKPKSEDTNQEKLYLLHMDLCRPMCVASVNGKKYILVIIDDYSRFTWVKFLRSKDEAPDFIIKFLKMIQLRLKVPV
ncbi:retrovirus-related pol polyprotein from transposon TNT 1-94 [Tanacetum coccineum]